MITKRVKSALKYSIFDGIAYSAMLGFGEHFLLAYAILMSANDLQLGVLATLPILLASIMQLFSVRFMNRMHSRKKSVILFAVIQALMWLPIIFIYTLSHDKIFSLILFVSLYWIFGLMTNPIWTSWIGDLVPSSIRGKFFARRTGLTSLAAFLSFIIGGLILNYAKEALGDAFLGFAIIFGLAMLSRILSVIFLAKQYEPEFNIIKKDEFTLGRFLKHFKEGFKEGHFSTLVIYLAIMYFAFYLSAPYFVAYLLNSLALEYWQYVVVVGVSILVQIMFLPAWGYYSDKYGSLAILKLTGMLIPFIPLFWIFSRTIPSLIVAQLFGGFVWSGFMLSYFNFLLETTEPENRANSISYFNLINGVFIFLGSLAGAGLLKVFSMIEISGFLKEVFWTKYVFLFFISALLRFFNSAIVLPKLKDIKRHRRITTKELAVKVISALPGKGLHISVHVKR